MKKKRAQHEPAPLPDALKAAGWAVGSADEFLKLSEAESRQVDAAMPPIPEFRIPEGWTLETLERRPDYALITTVPPVRYMATVDFRLRGFRSGYSTTGPLFSEAWNKRRKKYGGRGWKQSIVDDAVAHLQEVLR